VGQDDQWLIAGYSSHSKKDKLAILKELVTAFSMAMGWFQIVSCKFFFQIWVRYGQLEFNFVILRSAQESE